MNVHNFLVCALLGSSIMCFAPPPNEPGPAAPFLPHAPQNVLPILINSAQLFIPWIVTGLFYGGCVVAANCYNVYKINAEQKRQQPKNEAPRSKLTGYLIPISRQDLTILT